MHRNVLTQVVRINSKLLRTKIINKRHTLELWLETTAFIIALRYYKHSMNLIQAGTLKASSQMNTFIICRVSVRTATGIGFESVISFALLMNQSYWIRGGYQTNTASVSQILLRLKVGYFLNESIPILSCWNTSLEFYYLNLHLIIYLINYHNQFTILYYWFTHSILGLNSYKY